LGGARERRGGEEHNRNARHGIRARG
jgi:hypothetical protein